MEYVEKFLATMNNFFSVSLYLCVSVFFVGRRSLTGNTEAQRHRDTDIFILSFTVLVFSLIATSPGSAKTQTTQKPVIEGCVSCHTRIEPMHKYGTTETLTELKDGKDAVGLSCTACHGGNPVPTKTSD